MLAHYNSHWYWNWIGIVLLLFTLSCSEAENHSTGSKPVSHEIWDRLIQKHVAENGQVNYPSMRTDSTLFYEYLEILNKAHPDNATWSEDEQLAYWINAYNAFTVQLIIENYPLESIKDLQGALAVPFINSVWDEVFIRIEDVEYSLNDIEHRILRKKYNEPRIHFAINCASVSCPILRNEAYIAAKIENQLQEQALRFINNPDKNQISKDEIRISRIFQWFRGDFTKDGSLIDFLNQYSEIRIHEDAEIGYLKYDWNLNE